MPWRCCRARSPRSGAHHPHLITTMSVHLVARTRAEVADAQTEVVARLRREQRLPRHRTTGEQGSVHGLSWDLAGFMHLHSSILLSGYRAFLVSRGSVPASQCPCNGASAGMVIGTCLFSRRG